MYEYVKCKFCTKFFKAHKWQKRSYCSPQCYHSSRVKSKIQFNCFHCGKIFTDKKGFKFRKYCSEECKHKIDNKYWNPSYSCIRKRYQLRGWIKECEKCGYKDYPEILGIHHKDQNRRNNSKDNLMVLCPNCHSLEHRKHVSH